MSLSASDAAAIMFGAYCALAFVGIVCAVQTTIGEARAWRAYRARRALHASRLGLAPIRQKGITSAFARFASKEIARGVKRLPASL